MSNKTVVSVLRQARARIENPRRWRKGALGSDAAYTRPSVRDTCKVCALGAVNWADTGNPYGHTTDVGRMAAQLLDDVARNSELRPGSSIVGFNDAYNTKHKDVLAVFDEAIKVAEATETVAA